LCLQSYVYSFILRFMWLIVDLRPVKCFLLVFISPSWCTYRT